MAVEIIITEKVDLKDHVFIDGFPGIGLVGTIAAGYLIEKRKMKPIGYIYSDQFPPMTAVYSGKPYFPVRIYKDQKEKFCVLLAEFVIPSHLIHALSSSILKFVKENKVRQIVSLAGMTSVKEKEEPEVYAIASNDEMLNYLKKKKIKLIPQGVTTGVSGVLIAKCSAENFPAFSLLAESTYGYPDPRASAALLKKLEDLIGLKVDVHGLLQEAGEIESKMRKLFEEFRKVKKTYKKAEEEYPPMYG